MRSGPTCTRTSDGWHASGPNPRSCRVTTVCPAWPCARLSSAHRGPPPSAVHWLEVKLHAPRGHVYSKFWRADCVRTGTAVVPRAHRYAWACLVLGCRLFAQGPTPSACGSVGGPGDHVPGAACTRTLGQLISYGPELLSCRIPSVCGAGPCVRPPTRQPGRLAFRELSARGRAAIGGRSRRLRTASPRVHTRGDGMAGRTGADGTARRADVSRQSAGVPLHARRLRRACAGRYKPHAVRPGCEDTWGTRCSLAPVRLPGRRW